MRKSVISQGVVSSGSTAKSIASSVVPKRFSAVDMLKFRNIIKPVENKIVNVRVEELDIKSKEWVVLGSVSFLTETAPFGEGSFRYVFKALSNILEMQPT